MKIRGYRIEPEDIEAALARHPQVKQAVVTVHERTPGDKRLVGYVVSDSATPPQAEELRSYLLDILPDYMVPADYLWLEKLPLTPNGKIDRNALPAVNELPAGEDQAWSAPESEAEQTIAEIWGALLGVPKVGRDSNFFDLGGHSLLMIRVRSKLEEAFGAEIAITELFRHSTVRTLAKYLSGANIECRRCQPAVWNRFRPGKIPHDNACNDANQGDYKKRSESLPDFPANISHLHHMCQDTQNRLQLQEERDPWLICVRP